MSVGGGWVNECMWCVRCMYACMYVYTYVCSVCVCTYVCLYSSISHAMQW